MFIFKQYEIKLEKSEKNLKAENDSLRSYGTQKENECVQLRAQLDQASTGQGEQLNNMQKELQHLNLNLQVNNCLITRIFLLIF